MGTDTAVRRRLARVHFVCDAHCGPVEPRTSGTITIVGGKWAYCQASVILGHRWIATDGIPIMDIVTARAR